MKIVGYQTKGNLIRFYLGANDVTPTYNTEKIKACSHTITFNEGYTAPGLYPYANFVTGYKDYIVGWNKTAFTLSHYLDSLYVKELKKQLHPLIVIADSGNEDNTQDYHRHEGAKNLMKFYLFDEMEPDEIGLPENYPEKSIGD